MPCADTTLSLRTPSMLDQAGVQAVLNDFEYMFCCHTGILQKNNGNLLNLLPFTNLRSLVPKWQKGGQHRHSGAVPQGGSNICSKSTCYAKFGIRRGPGKGPDESEPVRAIPSHPPTGPKGAQLATNNHRALEMYGKLLLGHGHQLFY